MMEERIHENGQGTTIILNGCQPHYWRVDSPSDTIEGVDYVNLENEVFRAECKKCGVTREFPTNLNRSGTVSGLGYSNSPFR